MRISTAMAHQQGLHAILDQQSKLQHTQQQMATGRRVISPSDDPVAATLALDLEQIKQRNDQFGKNADFAESRLQFTETTLGSVSLTLQRVRELAVQALNDTNGPEQRRGIAAEVEQRFAELLGLANSSDGAGEYIFAGFVGDRQPFSGSVATGAQYVGDQGQRFLEIGPGRKVAVTESGFEVFGKVANHDTDPNATRNYVDVFSIIKGFVDDLKSDQMHWEEPEPAATNAGSGSIGSLNVSGDNGILSTWPDGHDVVLQYDGVGGQFTAALGGWSASLADGSPAFPLSYDPLTDAGKSYPMTLDDGNGNTIDVEFTVGGTPSDADQFTIHVGYKRDNILNGLDNAMENVDLARARIGARLNTLDDQRNINESYGLDLEQAKSKLMDLDYADAISRFNLQMVGLEAAQKTFQGVQQLSLFNFI
jgi:flagellar hook-associated protein 3 FlgL